MSKPLNAIGRIFTEAFDEKMGEFPGPFELGKDRSQQGIREGDEGFLAEQAASGGVDTSRAPLQMPYKPRVRRPSPVPSSLNGVQETLCASTSRPIDPYTNQPLALGPSRALHPLPPHLQLLGQPQHISRTPTPSLDLSAVQAEIDKAHAHANAASRATLAQIFPGLDAEVREWVLEANGGDLGKSIEALLEMNASS